MKKLIALASALVALSANAAYIDGSLGFTGTYGTNDPQLNQATLLTFAPGNVTIAGVPTGSFAGFVNTGDIVTMFSPLQVNQGVTQTGVVLPGGPIWQVGGFELNLSSLVELPGNSGSVLSLYGLGLISGNGFDATEGEWVATFNRSGNNQNISLTFSATSAGFPPSSVPEGGTSAVLLGLGLVAIGFVARRR